MHQAVALVEPSDRVIVDPRPAKKSASLAWSRAKAFPGKGSASTAGGRSLVRMRFWGIDSQRDRRRIQALRADPPGLAASGARRRVFGAALEQWDALLEASGEVVPDAAPILLFYALSQAGRAVCAARIPGQPWRARGHGLGIGDPAPAGDLGTTTVKPDGGANTSFAMFCRATQSGTLTTPTTLGALWAANPKLEAAPGLGDGDVPALDLNPITSGETATRVLLLGAVAEGLPSDQADAEAELAIRLAGYPGAAEGLAVSDASPRLSHDGRPQIEIAWRRSDGTAMAIEMIAPGYGMPNSGAYLRPALSSSGDVLEPLPLWWATLLALSSLARYHPEAWSAALARDRSQAAVPIEETLDIGREMLPWLLLGTLERP